MARPFKSSRQKRQPRNTVSLPNHLFSHLRFQSYIKWSATLSTSALNVRPMSATLLPAVRKITERLKGRSTLLRSGRPVEELHLAACKCLLSGHSPNFTAKCQKEYKLIKFLFPFFFATVNHVPATATHHLMPEYS